MLSKIAFATQKRHTAKETNNIITNELLRETTFLQASLKIIPLVLFALVPGIGNNFL